jgi:mitogen-activated protein kinase 1/3
MQGDKIEHKVGGVPFMLSRYYTPIKVIGHGAYGVVISATDLRSNTKVAIKKVTNAFADLTDAKRILREIKLLQFCSHENLVQILDIEMPPARVGYKDIYIVTDLMDTDMFRIINSKQAINDEHIQCFMYQTLRGLLFLHTANIIHRDLKPSNILVNKNCDLKICDLGLARSFDADTTQYTEYVVTRWYRAPEIILSASEYTKQIDIWSIGCIFAELLGRKPLFPGVDYLDQVKRIIAVLGYPSEADKTFITNPSARRFLARIPMKKKIEWRRLYPRANPQALDLLDKMLQFNPGRRLNVGQCLRHPYFASICDSEEPVALELFDWGFDNFEPTEELLQSMMYDEAAKFHKV